jgi:SlyX protein
VNSETQRLEEKIAFLEHHVTEQDKVILELTQELARLKSELKRLAGRVSLGAEASGETPLPADERPPHY